jgi:excisionase family DNA binding protein
MKRNRAGESPEIMTLQDVAEYLNCHPITVHRLLDHGELRAFRLGSNWRFRRADIDQWIAGYEVKSDQGKPRKGR